MPELLRARSWPASAREFSGIDTSAERRRAHRAGDATPRSRQASRFSSRCRSISPARRGAALPGQQRAQAFHEIRMRVAQVLRLRRISGEVEELVVLRRFQRPDPRPIRPLLTAMLELRRIHAFDELPVAHPDRVGRVPGLEHDLAAHGSAGLRLAERAQHVDAVPAASSGSRTSRIRASVASRSARQITWSLVEPAGTLPGQRTRNGSRKPPSQRRAFRRAALR